MCLIDATGLLGFREVVRRALCQKSVLPLLILALVAPVGAGAQEANDAAACPRIAVPPDATVIAMGFSVGQAMADIYIDDPNAPLSVVDVEIEAGEGRIFVVGATENAAIWRFSGDTRRVAGGLFIGNRSLVTRRLAPAGVVGLRPEIVTIPPPDTCPLTQRLFAEMSGREIDTTLDLRASNLSKVALPSGRIARTGDSTFYRYPGETSPDLEAEAARLWLEFLKSFQGGLVDIHPAHVVSLQPAKDYEQLPGLLGLAQLVSDGTLELTGTPDNLVSWWGELGEDWVDPDLRWRLPELLRRKRGDAKIAEDGKWLRTRLADWTVAARLGENPEGNLHGNRFRLDGNDAIIENARGNWVPLETIELIIRGPLTVPPAIPGSTRLPMFLLPAGVPEPIGPFRRELPLLREAVD